MRAVFDIRKQYGRPVSSQGVWVAIMAGLLCGFALFARRLARLLPIFVTCFGQVVWVLAFS